VRFFGIAFALLALLLTGLALHGRSSHVRVTSPGQSVPRGESASMSSQNRILPSAPASVSSSGSRDVPDARAWYEDFVREAGLDQRTRQELDTSLVELGQLLERGPLMHAGEDSAFYFAAFERTLSRMERTLPPRTIGRFRSQIAPILPALVKSQTGHAPRSDEELSFAEIYAEFMRQFERPSP
jgi:hypothetical protein